MRPRKYLACLLILATGLFCGSCHIPTLPQYAVLGNLRILSLVALGNQSEVNPGTSGIVIQPVVSDLSGGGRTLTVTVQTCSDPGIAAGAQPQCATVDSTTSSSFSTTTLSANSTYTGLAPTVSINVPAAPINYALATPSEQYNGLPYLVFYTITASDGTTVTALKRIMVSSPSKATKNQNPAISSITASGAPLTATSTFSTSPTALAIYFSTGAEIYQYENPDGSFTSMTETLTTTWFYSDGSVAYDRTINTDPNQWNPPSAHPSGRAAVLVVITRDGRAGETVQKYEFN